MAGKKGQKINRDECIRFKEYYLKNFPEWSEEECINAANKIKRQSNYKCIEYYEHKYPELSHEEHVLLRKHINRHGPNKHHLNIFFVHNHHRNSNRRYLLFHIFLRKKNIS